MSTAPSESLPFIDEDHQAPPEATTRHLRAVPNPTLQVEHPPSVSTTDVRQSALLERPIIDPQEEFSPSHEAKSHHATIVQLQSSNTANPSDDRVAAQLSAIKRMTRTIGWAFIESELGIRPFAQLSTWIELELFHKLRVRVMQAAALQHTAARRGKDSSRKVPSIMPLGVRAYLTANGDWETSMTIKVGQRARAIAMRLQLHRNRWQVIALEVG